MELIDCLSVVVPVTERHDDLPELYREYRQHLQGRARVLEFIFVIDGHFPRASRELALLSQQESAVHVIDLPRHFGEATALTVGFENSTGDVLLTLPAYRQVNAGGLGRLLDALEGADMAVVRRFPRVDSGLRRLQSAVFNGCLRALTGTVFRDIGCNVRALRRRVVGEIHLYGDLHRFLPLLGVREGFRVVEIDIEQAKSSSAPIHGPGVYVRRLLDMLTIFFLLKFTKKPLRFFGLVGATCLGLGVLALLLIIAQRFFFDVPMSDRPALVLSTLFVVLGVQIVALGLIGELIIFTHAGELKEYKIERIVSSEGAAADPTPVHEMTAVERRA